LAKRRGRFQSFILLTALVAVGCSTSMPKPVPPGVRRDINLVLADHSKRLMAIPGVVGVYHGLLDDGKTPCLKVMLRKSDKALERSLPRELDGYPVVPEVTGEIRPLGSR
jgi:hypothetical protein